MIYGAGASGQALLKALRVHRPDVCVRAFLDDDPSRIGTRVLDLPVLAPAPPATAELLIAIPSLTGEKIRRIAEACRERGVAVRTLPCREDIDPGIALDLHLRPVRIDDLFRREWPGAPERICALLRDKVVLVTGAAGSIGSQLCRVVAGYEPAALVGLDNAESGLFELDQEMTRRFPALAFYPALGSVQDGSRVERLLRKFRPHVVYHAAAYKHVPMLQNEVCEAARNNVLGTWTLCSAAAREAVDRFILVSTDKAVRARNVLGLSKRLAEMAVESIAQEKRAFFAVRPGNVIGSSGSVARTFQTQIERRLPVTVTDVRMERYFTTLAESARFIVEASAMGSAGSVYSLDMGKPVRIVELAAEMIRLSGLRPEVDVPIVFSGSRAGEELRESLFDADQLPEASGHPLIQRIRGSRAPVPLERMRSLLRELEECCSMERHDLARAVMESAVRRDSAAEIVAVAHDQG